jgi:hypothetical protein
MERIVVIHESHAAAAAAAAAADARELAALTPQERLDRMLALIARHREALGEAGRGLARVARVVPFPRD